MWERSVKFIWQCDTGFFLQHIIDQLEYSPIKRRLEAGVLAWAWANQDEDDDEKGSIQPDVICDSDDDTAAVHESKSEEAEGANQIKKQLPPKPGNEARVSIGGILAGQL